MQENHEPSDNGPFHYDVKVPFPLRLVALIIVAGLYYLGQYGFRIV